MPGKNSGVDGTRTQVVSEKCSEFEKSTPLFSPNSDPMSYHSTHSLDAIEHALATALERAAGAGQWGVVSQLAQELESRRRSKNNVVTLPTRRATNAAK